MPVPSTHDFADGLATSTEMNSYVRDPIQFLLAPPIANLRQTAAQSLTTAVVTALTFNTEDVDSAGGHDNVTNNSRYSANYAGWYQVSCGAAFSANATGQRFVQLKVNGSDANGTGAEINATAALNCLVAGRTTLIYLNVSDYVEAYAFQNSGGNLNTAVTTYEHSSLTVQWRST